MSFGLVSVTAETNCSLMVPLLVTAVSGKTTFGRSLMWTQYAVMTFVSLAIRPTPAYSAIPRIWGSASNGGVPVYIPAFASMHCAHTQRDGQAKLTSTAGYVLRQFIQKWSPNQARYKAPSLTEASPTLPLKFRQLSVDLNVL